MKLTISLAFALVASQICRGQVGWSGSVGSDSGVTITVGRSLNRLNQTCQPTSSRPSLGSNG